MSNIRVCDTGSNSEGLHGTQAYFEEGGLDERSPPKVSHIADDGYMEWLINSEPTAATVSADQSY